jgi:hypothetical protein
MVRTKADSSCVKGKYTTMSFHIPFCRKFVCNLGFNGYVTLLTQTRLQPSRWQKEYFYLKQIRPWRVLYLWPSYMKDEWNVNEFWCVIFSLNVIHMGWSQTLAWTEECFSSQLLVPKHYGRWQAVLPLLLTATRVRICMLWLCKLNGYQFCTRTE